MDTDDLSIPTYNGIIIEAEKFNHDLTLQFGILSGECQNDDDYLNSAELLIQYWIKIKDFNQIIENVFYDSPVNEIEFKNTLEKILNNINEIRKTPMNEREFKL